MATFTVFTKEDTDIHKFYSSIPDALKELILEREYYKKMSEVQQEQFNGPKSV